MEIRRLWGGQPQAWWDEMDGDEKARMFAWWKVHQDPTGKANTPQRHQQTTSAAAVARARAARRAGRPR